MVKRILGKDKKFSVQSTIDILDLLLYMYSLLPLRAKLTSLKCGLDLVCRIHL
jgi:hypothetical protein